MNLQKVIFILGIIFVVARSTYADHLRAAVDSAFTAGHYEQVELFMLRAGDSLAADSDSDRVALLLTTGYALIMLERPQDAQMYYRRALDINHNLNLDPMRVSPKFRSVFEDVKAGYRPPPKLDPVRTSLVGPKTSSTVINLVLPGAGQWREQKKMRGVVWGGLQVASAGILIWRANELQKSRHRYLTETNRNFIGRDYDRYASDTRWTWAAGIATAAVYLGAQVDLALLRTPVIEPKLSLFPAHQSLGISACLTW